VELLTAGDLEIHNGFIRAQNATIATSICDMSPCLFEIYLTEYSIEYVVNESTPVELALPIGIKSAPIVSFGEGVSQVIMMTGARAAKPTTSRRLQACHPYCDGANCGISFNDGTGCLECGIGDIIVNGVDTTGRKRRYDTREPNTVDSNPDFYLCLKECPTSTTLTTSTRDGTEYVDCVRSRTVITTFDYLDLANRGIIDLPVVQVPGELELVGGDERGNGLGDP
jgi:hypothetical protein